MGVEYGYFRRILIRPLYLCYELLILNYDSFITRIQIPDIPSLEQVSLHTYCANVPISLRFYK